jgi:hypothetical protein
MLKISVEVVWLCDRTRPFVLVLIEQEVVEPILSPLAHLGVACPSRQFGDELCQQGRQEGKLSWLYLIYLLLTLEFCLFSKSSY